MSLDFDRFAFGAETGGEVVPPPVTHVSQPVKQHESKKTRQKQEQDLYVITSESFPGLLKVGRSNKPERRLLDLSGGQPVRYDLILVLHGAGELELAVHRHLASMRHTTGHSREWFKCEVDDVIEALRAVAGSEILEQMEQMCVSVTVFQ